MSLSAIVHVGSSTISAALVDAKKIIFAASREYRFQEQLDQKVFLDTVAESFKLVLQDLTQAKRGSPSPVTIFLASPFIAGRLNILRRQADRPFKITAGLLSELANTDLEALKKDQRHEVVDSQVMRYMVNGYAVAQPEGQHASNLELAHYVSVGDRELLKKFRDIVKNVFHQDQVRFHSASLAIFASLLRTRPQAHSSLVLLEVGGEVTELSFINQGLIQESFSFPLGSHSLVRDRVQKAQLSPAVAKSHLELGHAKADTAEQAWQEQLLTGLKQVVQHGFWSGEVVLLVEDQALCTRFAELLSSELFSKLSFSAKSTEASTLCADNFTKHVSIEAGVNPSLPLIASSGFVLI